MKVDVRVDKRLQEALSSIRRDRLDDFYGRCIERANRVLENGGKRGTYREVVEVPESVGKKWDRLRFGNRKQALTVLHDIIKEELGA